MQGTSKVIVGALLVLCSNYCTGYRVTRLARRYLPFRGPVIKRLEESPPDVSMHPPPPTMVCMYLKSIQFDIALRIHVLLSF